MAPERPGPEDEPGVAFIPNDSVTIPITLLSIPNSLLQIKEGDGASEGRSEKGSEDDELTSLTWLQDKNLLKGINLQTNVTGVEESPVIEYVDDCVSERESSCSSVNSTGPISPPTTVPLIKNKHPHHIPYNPQVHTTSKPPYSFSCLIFMAIEESSNKALPVKEIYGWILEHFPFYKNAPTGWKNSVRHNLSLNKCFRKVEKAPNLGKGSLWMVDPPYRTNLMQALQKAPYHPCNTLDKAAPACNNSSSVKVMTSSIAKVNCHSRLPDPSLFPNLARRLAAVEGSDPLEDVDAAAAMLELKHGPALRKDEYHRRLGAHLLQAARGVRRKIKAELSDAKLVASSPSGDHTYSSAEPSATTINIDYVFSWGSQEPQVKIETESADVEEQRKIAEGADALLNLAGITTRPTPPVNPRKRQNSPFRPRLLRKPSPVNGLKNHWKSNLDWKSDGIMSENNNIIKNENIYENIQPPVKVRRKTQMGSGKGVGKYKR